MGFEEIDAFREAIFGNDGIGIEKENKFSFSAFKATVTGFCKTNIRFIRDEMYLREPGLEVIKTSVFGLIVNYNHLHILSHSTLLHREQALLQEVFNIVINYDDRQSQPEEILNGQTYKINEQRARKAKARRG